jgi:hypothetical protein
MFRKLLDTGEAGDNVGILLRGIERDDIERGQVLCKPGSITPHTKFEAQAYVLKKDEGGRHTPFFTKYRHSIAPSSGAQESTSLHTWIPWPQAPSSQTLRPLLQSLCLRFQLLEASLIRSIAMHRRAR